MLWDSGLSPNLSSVSLGKALREVSAKVGTREWPVEGACGGGVLAGQQESPLEAALRHGRWLLPRGVTPALQKALGAGGGHRDRLGVHRA